MLLTPKKPHYEEINEINLSIMTALKIGFFNEKSEDNERLRSLEAIKVF